MIPQAPADHLQALVRDLGHRADRLLADRGADDPAAVAVLEVAAAVGNLAREMRGRA